MPSLSVVIPVFHSERSIGLVVRQLAEALPKITDCYEVVLVEDNGDDGSWQVVESLAAEYEWVRGYKLMRNYGQHSALLCGIRAAKFEIIVTIDDDLQHPVDRVSSLIELLNAGYDVVYGTPQRQRHSLLRNLASIMTKWVLQGAMGAETARSISAFRAFRTSLRDSFASYHGPLVNIDVLLTWGTTRFICHTYASCAKDIGQIELYVWQTYHPYFQLVDWFQHLAFAFRQRAWLALDSIWILDPGVYLAEPGFCISV